MPVSYMPQSILHNSLISQLTVIFQGYESLEMIKISPLMTTVIQAFLDVYTIVLNQFVFVFFFFFYLTDSVVFWLILIIFQIPISLLYHKKKLYTSHTILAEQS